tara:strand:+ start:288 stop:476 length:189 start_codon:yes stop_codon:yes gene_type:complete
MENTKTIIDIKGVITNIDNTEITKKQYDEIVDLFLELLESKSYCFGGGFAHCSEKEWEENNQ